MSSEDCSSNTEQVQAGSVLELPGMVAELAGIGLRDWHIPSGRVTYSGKWEHITGRDTKTLPKDISVWGNALLPEDRGDADRLIKEHLEGHTEQYEAVVRVRLHDGRIIWAKDKGKVTERDRGGNPIRFVGMTQETTEMRPGGEQYKKDYELFQSEIDHAMERLDQSRHNNEALFNANPYVNLIFDSDFKLLDCNPAAVQYFGFSSKEALLAGYLPIVQEMVPSFQPGGQPSVSLEERIRYTLQNGYNEFETEIIIRGEKTPINAIFKRIEYMGSYAVAIYLVDMKMMKAARNEILHHDRMLAAANAAASILLATDQSDSPVEAIRSALEVLGESINVDRAYIWRNSISEDGRICCSEVCEWARMRSSPNRGNLPPSDISYDEMLPNWREILAKYPSLNSIVRELNKALIDFPGMQDVLSILIIPIFMCGEFWGFLGFDDCTNERTFTQVEEDILKSGGIMIASAMIRNEMTRSLVLAREEALESASAKTEFLSRMSHEIRTPMNAIIGMTTIAKKSNDPSRIRYCLEKIDASSRQLLSIINDILDMSKIQADKFDILIGEFDFENMIQNVMNITQVKAEEKSQDLKVEFDDVFSRKVVCDELRLSQVLINLLNNAVKFTPDGGNIALRISKTSIDENRAVLHVEVADDGIGIRPEQKSSLFKSFEQVDGGITRKYGGTGLGLAICKKIIDLMDGDIRVESEPGVGSRFIFNVEILWGEELRPELAKKGALKEIRVLAVDDSEDILMFFKSVLGSFSMDCDTAAGGKLAVDAVKSALEAGNPYDVIFVDWMMPGMNGIETARQIKSVMNDDIIVIMVSVAEWPEIEKEAAKYNITKYLPKPILPSVLFNTIMEITGGKAAQSDAEMPAKVKDWSGKAILLAEDIEINREVLYAILEESGVTIESAANGLEAVSRFLEGDGKYDAILMDVQMPELDGLDATRRIRALGFPNARNIPIIAMTANAFKEDVAQCLEAGMNDHVAKPINVEDLYSKLSPYLDK